MECNDVMHFDPEGLTRDQCITLEATAQYLRILSSKLLNFTKHLHMSQIICNFATLIE